MKEIKKTANFNICIFRKNTWLAIEESWPTMAKMSERVGVKLKSTGT